MGKLYGLVSAPDTGRFNFKKKTKKDYPPPKIGWQPWVENHFAKGASAPFGHRHIRLWEWFDKLKKGKKPRARVEVWPRGGAKSWTAESGTVWVGVKKTRMFVLYVSGTQAQANKHVQAIAAKFETLGYGRAVNKYGTSMGWRLDLLRVDNGFSVLALGLDAAARGIRIEDFRPDLIIFDDVDDRHDTEATVQKKKETITDSILPAGSTDAAVLFVQNRIHENSIVAQLTDGKADFLMGREVFQEPAIEDMEITTETMPDGTIEYRIIGGQPTWEGQNLAIAEAQLNEWGRSAFTREANHETGESEDGLWQRARDIDPYRRTKMEVPPLTRIVVGVDPNAGEGGDAAGIIVGGEAWIHGKRHGYLLEDNTVKGGPATWAKEAVAAYHRHKADALVAESNNGGDMVKITISTVPGAPPVKLLHASRGKLTRAEPVQKLAEEGFIHHVGVFVELEKELCTWKPGDDSPNRLDAMVWTFTELMLGNTRPNLPTASASYATY